jgi:hypothetical protein
MNVHHITGSNLLDAPDTDFAEAMARSGSPYRLQASQGHLHDLQDIGPLDGTACTEDDTGARLPSNPARLGNIIFGGVIALICLVAVLAPVVAFIQRMP